MSRMRVRLPGREGEAKINDDDDRTGIEYALYHTVRNMTGCGEHPVVSSWGTGTKLFYASVLFTPS